jgi:putative transposase
MTTKKHHTPEVIIRKLRKEEIMFHAGKSVSEACRYLEISDTTYYKRRREYG